MGAMANGSTYDFGATFAQLMCILEDATAPASHGQSSQLDRSACLRPVAELEQHIDQAGLLLKEIKAALE